MPIFMNAFFFLKVYLVVQRESALGIGFLLYLTAYLPHCSASTVRNLMYFLQTGIAKFSKCFLVPKAYRCNSTITMT